jgi:hypothetical protein
MRDPVSAIGWPRYFPGAADRGKALTLALLPLIVTAVRTRIALALALVTLAGLGSQVVSACGDKFLLVGRGVTFRHAYAAIHPASILLVLPPKSVKSSAVRDSGLLAALKMAGHRVDVIQQPAALSEILGRARHDIVLAERADASDVLAGAAGQPKPPTIIGILEKPSGAELTSARQQFEYVLETPQSLPHILNLLDDVMKARLGGGHPTPIPGA